MNQQGHRYSTMRLSKAEPWIRMGWRYIAVTEPMIGLTMTEGIRRVAHDWANRFPTNFSRDVERPRRARCFADSVPTAMRKTSHLLSGVSHYR